ncbi:MAG: HDOD domain-containing protein [Thermodesulfobacteriota bacterium]
MSSAKKIIEKFGDIKTLSHVVTRLSKLIADEDSTIKDFEEVIRMDPTLVVRLLRLVNSPYYGLTTKVDSIGRAVTFIGMQNLHNIAVTDALINIFTTDSRQEIFSRQQLWLHCAAVSTCAKMVAERLFGINGDDAYLCGILHDFGLIVEEQVDNANFLKACAAGSSEEIITIHERKYLDTDHCEIGYIMTLDWDMPVAIQEAIRDHHTFSDDTAPDSLTGILQISEYITGQLDYTALPGSVSYLPDSLITHMQENMEEYKLIIDDFPEEMSKANELYSSN